MSSSDRKAASSSAVKGTTAFHGQVVKPPRPADYRLYQDELAERLKARCGQPYQPSNGFEGDLFMGRWCARCTLDTLDDDSGDGGCDIMGWAMATSPGEPGYPAEWQYADDGQPICTAFSPRPGVALAPADERGAVVPRAAQTPEQDLG